MMGKRGRSPFIAIQHIKDFNELKTELGNKPFTKETFRSELKKRNIVSNNVFWFSLIRFNLIKKVSRDHFAFMNNKPIHFTLLENVYLDYFNKVNGYNNAWKEKKEKKTQETQVTAAIKFLSSLGFHIYAPVGDLYSKLQRIKIVKVVINTEFIKL